MPILLNLACPFSQHAHALIVGCREHVDGEMTRMPKFDAMSVLCARSELYARSARPVMAGVIGGHADPYLHPGMPPTLPRPLKGW
jgi:hypothetical protein